MVASSLPEPKPVLVEKLSLDTSNPRMVEAPSNLEPDAMLRYLWRDWAVREVALSIAHNGYFTHEPLFAAREGDKLVVIEGNRRLAAVKLLLDANLRKQVGATDLPEISAARRAELRSLPVIEAPRRSIWQYIGFKHVNGPQPWNSIAKAEYIAWVHNELGQSLDTIAKSIGDEHTTVKRLYRGLMALQQAEAAKVFSRDDRAQKHFSFSHLYTGLDYPGVQSFLGISKDGSFKEKPVPRKHVGELGELCEWLYGSKSKPQAPLIKSQNPDLRKLDEVLQSKDGVAALRRHISLDVSLNVSRGDERLLREALITAKTSLQEARGIILSGYKGQSEMLETARAVSDLAVAIYDEMLDMQQRGSSRRRARTART